MKSWKVNQHRTMSAGTTLVAMLTTCCLAGGASAQQGEEQRTIAYRLPTGNTMHFDDLQKAADHLKAVTQLGCEVARSQHSGHDDVSYKCATWRTITVANDELAHQWQTWLIGAGFETLHGCNVEHDDAHAHGESEEQHAHDHAHHHGPESEKHEEVAYRIPKWLTLHPRQESEAAELVAIAQGLGCEVRQSKHADHIDVSIRCPEWKHVDFPSHEVANNWEKWLSKTGFETRHHHSKEPAAADR